MASRAESGVVVVALAAALAGCAGAQKRREAEQRVEQANYWYLKAHKYNEAGKLYAEALELTEWEYPEASFGLGSVRREQCRMEAQHFVDGDPNKGIDTARVRLDYEESELAFLVTIKLQPGYRDAYYGLGMLYYDMAVCGPLNSPREQRRTWLLKSAERFEKAYEIDRHPKSGAPHEYLAQIYNLLGLDADEHGELPQAIGYFEKARGSCDRFLAWFRVQPIVMDLPEESDKRIAQFEGLAKDIGAVLPKLRERLGLAGSAPDGGTPR